MMPESINTNANPCNHPRLSSTLLHRPPLPSSNHLPTSVSLPSFLPLPNTSTCSLPFRTPTSNGLPFANPLNYHANMNSLLVPLSADQNNVPRVQTTTSYGADFPCIPQPCDIINSPAVNPRINCESSQLIRSPISPYLNLDPTLTSPISRLSPTSQLCLHSTLSPPFSHVSPTSPHPCIDPSLSPSPAHLSPTSPYQNSRQIPPAPHISPTTPQSYHGHSPNASSLQSPSTSLVRHSPTTPTAFTCQAFASPLPHLSPSTPQSHHIGSPSIPPLPHNQDPDAQKRCHNDPLATSPSHQSQNSGAPPYSCQKSRSHPARSPTRPYSYPSSDAPGLHLNLPQSLHHIQPTNTLLADRNHSPTSSLSCHTTTPPQGSNQSPVTPQSTSNVSPSSLNSLHTATTPQANYHTPSTSISNHSHSPISPNSCNTSSTITQAFHHSPTTPKADPNHSSSTPPPHPDSNNDGPISINLLDNILSPNIVDLTNLGATDSEEAHLSPSPTSLPPAFPTPSPSLLGDGCEVKNLINLECDAGKSEERMRDEGAKSDIQRTKEWETEGSKGEYEDSGGEGKGEKIWRDMIGQKVDDLDPYWKNRLLPLSPPPSPTYPNEKTITKDPDSDCHREEVKEPLCQKKIYENLMYQEDSNDGCERKQEDSQCNKDLSRYKKHRQKDRKRRRKPHTEQEHDQEDEDQSHAEEKPRSRPHKGEKRPRKRDCSKTRNKNRHPPNLLSDFHDEKPDQLKGDSPAARYRRLDLPMIDDEPDCCDYRCPDPSSHSSRSTTTTSSSSSLSLDFSELGASAAELAEAIGDVTEGAGKFIKDEIIEGIIYLTQPEDTVEFVWRDAVTVLLSIATFYFDAVSDSLLLYCMVDDPDSGHFFLPTLLLRVIPLFIANAFSLYWYWFDERGCGGDGYHPHPPANRWVWALRLVAHALLQAPVLRQGDIWYYGTKSTAETVLEEAKVDELMSADLRPTSSPITPSNTMEKAPLKGRCSGGVCVRRGGFVALWLHAERDAANAELILALLQDAPLLLLHNYALELTLPPQAELGAISTTVMVQLWSVVVSFVTLAWAVASFIRATRLTEPSLPNLSYLGLMLLTLAHFCSIAGQVMSLSLCASRMVSLFFVVAGIHWGLMSLWVFVQLVVEPRTSCTRALFPHDQLQGRCHRLDDALYSAVMGLVFLFTFVDVGGAPSAVKARLYQVFILLEQMCLLTVWLVLCGELWWYHWVPLVLSPLLFCLNLTFDALFTLHVRPGYCLPLIPASTSVVSPKSV